MVYVQRPDKSEDNCFFYMLPLCFYRSKLHYYKKSTGTYESSINYLEDKVAQPHQESKDANYLHLAMPKRSTSFREAVSPHCMWEYRKKIIIRHFCQVTSRLTDLRDAADTADTAVVVPWSTHNTRSVICHPNSLLPRKTTATSYST